jgi:hypothetical protein
MTLICCSQFVFSFSSRASVDELSDKFLTVKPFVEIPGFDLEFVNEAESRKIKWAPNTDSITGLGFSFHGLLGFSLSLANPQDEQDKLKEGETDYQDWRLSYSLNEMSVQVNYLRYEGLYVVNSSEIDPSIRGSDPLIQYPDLYLRNISVNFNYSLNPKAYSLESTLDQTVRQTESGGSLLLGLAVSETIFSNPEPFIPSSVQSHFGDDQEIEFGRFRAISSKIGYGYNWIPMGDWYISAAVLLGPGLQWATFRTPAGDKKNQRTAFKVDAIFSTGYNGRTWLGGLSVLADGTNYKTNSISITSNLWATKVFMGRRF